MDKFIYTVTQLNNHSKSILENNLSNVWVEGEITSFQLYESGHAYFTIKDDRSELSCTWFNYETYNNLKEGINVTINGRVTLYNKRGKFQFQVKNAYVEGDGVISKKILELKNKLLKEGLFDKSFKKNIPKFPSNIAVISSIEGAVIKDIINIYNRRAPYLKLFLYNVNVQGDKSLGMIIDALKVINNRDDVDIVIIARGGGSSEDLNVFNKESLVRAVFNCNIPIITAIGHDIDNTLVDLVSDLRASTPSEAAEISVQNKSDLTQYLDSINSKIHLQFIDQYTNYLQLIESGRFIFSFDKSLIKIDSNSILLESLFSDLINKITMKIEFFNNNLNSYYKVLKKNNLQTLKKIGLSIIRKKDEIIINSDNIHIDDQLFIDMYEGNISIKVGEIIKNEK